MKYLSRCSGFDCRDRLGSARASRAGAGALAIANFSSPQSIAARRRNGHARQVRSPESSAALLGKPCRVWCVIALGAETDKFRVQ